MLLVVACLVFYVAYAEQGPAKTITLRWLILHTPIEPFERAARVFADVLEKETGNKVDLQILTRQDFPSSSKTNAAEEVFQLLDDGTVQLGSVYLYDVNQTIQTIPEFQALSLPYMFNDYESTENFIGNPLSHQILEKYSAQTSVRALALTFSGGFRIILSDKKLTSTDDFKGLHTVVRPGKYNLNFFTTIGAKLTVAPSDASGNKFYGPEINAAETSYIAAPRRLGPNTKFINETMHSLVMSMIITSDTFYNSLSARDQQAFQKAAALAAKAEREDSIALAERHKSELQQQGLTVVPMSSGMIEALRSQAQSTYDMFESDFGSDIITSIRAAEVTPL